MDVYLALVWGVMSPHSGEFPDQPTEITISHQVFTSTLPVAKKTNKKKPKIIEEWVALPGHDLG